MTAYNARRFSGGARTNRAVTTPAIRAIVTALARHQTHVASTVMSARYCR